MLEQKQRKPIFKLDSSKRSSYILHTSEVLIWTHTCLSFLGRRTNQMSSRQHNLHLSKSTESAPHTLNLTEQNNRSEGPRRYLPSGENSIWSKFLLHFPTPILRKVHSLLSLPVRVCVCVCVHCLQINTLFHKPTGPITTAEIRIDKFHLTLLILQVDPSSKRQISARVRFEPFVVFGRKKAEWVMTYLPQREEEGRLLPAETEERPMSAVLPGRDAESAPSNAISLRRASNLATHRTSAWSVLVMKSLQTDNNEATQHPCSVNTNRMSLPGVFSVQQWIAIRKNSPLCFAMFALGGHHGRNKSSSPRSFSKYRAATRLSSWK